MIIAVKDGIEKPFSPEAWQWMGKDKNGWVEKGAIPTADISNAKPSTGQAEKVEKPKKQSTKNIATDLATDAEFLSTVEKEVPASRIKDFLDMEEVTYANTATDAELAIILKDHLKGNIAELKNKFGI